jgi:glucose/arabinose dehydrogenase
VVWGGTGVKTKIVWALAALLLGGLPAFSVSAQTIRSKPLAEWLASILPQYASVTLEEVTGGFWLPLYVTNAGDGSDRLFVVERVGLIWIVEDGQRLPQPFLDISDRVKSDDGEQGFYAVAFHPNYEENGQFFVVYTRKPDGANMLERYTVSATDPNQANPDSGTTLLALPDEMPTHNGGDLAFSPIDGYLYYATGDGGGWGDPLKQAQDTQSLFGKMLRIDVDRGDPYTIPEDNPFVDDPAYRPEIWATGLRNPWRFSFDQLSGDLYIGDVGQDLWEELNFQAAGSGGGENYGWPIMEASYCFPPSDEACDETGLTPPILDYPHRADMDSEADLVGCVVTTGQVYRGSESASLQGGFVFGDFCSGQIAVAYRDSLARWRYHVLGNVDGWIASIGADERGELYLTDMRDGILYRLHFSDQIRPLRVTGLAPAGAPAGNGTLNVEISGTDLLPDTKVYWNDTPLEMTWNDETSITAVVPDGLLTQPGTAEIRVSLDSNGANWDVVPFVVSETVFGQPPFATTWSRTDEPVRGGVVQRSWIWGPEPLSPPILETYEDAPNGLRFVQYFDKSRMELADTSSQAGLWAVTNGLLVMELMSGRVQIGDALYEEREPALINVAGDGNDPSGVTYQTLAAFIEVEPSPEGTVLTTRLNRAGDTADDPSLASFDVTAGVLVEETGHRVASVFWEFMNAEGPVELDGTVVEGPLFENPFYATGLPVTEAYWTSVRVGGEERLVLVQAFERRVLTWTPDNEPNWRVEAGNVGRHYYEWRYQ